MAVTIDEMHVDVQEPPPSANAPVANSEPPKDVNLDEALAMLQLRKLRLRAD